MPSVLRNLPALSELLESPPLKSLVERVSRNVVVFRARRFLEDLAHQAQSAAANLQVPSAAELSSRIADWIARNEPADVAPIINATGRIFDPRLGGVPLAEEALQAVAAVTRGYVDVLATSQGDWQQGAVADMLRGLSGAESAIVSNGCGSALLLALSAASRGREVLVARGQLGTLQGGCTLPELIAASGAALREVGATNRTTLDDYAAGIGPQTGAILRVRTSEFAVVGASEEASVASLAKLASGRELPLIDFIEGAALIDMATYGVHGVPVVADSVAGGAHLTIFGGDQWIGGPPCGIIVGPGRWVSRVAGSPLFSLLAADKLTVAALSATLRLLPHADLAERSVPLFSLLSTPTENLQHRAERLAQQIMATRIAEVTVLPGQTAIACGAASPTVPTVSLALQPRSGTAESLAEQLSAARTPIVGRVEQGRLLLDLRSVPPREDLALAAAFESLQKAFDEPAEPRVEVPTISV